MNMAQGSENLQAGDTFQKSGETCTVVRVTYDGYLYYTWPDEDDTHYCLNLNPENEDERTDWADVCV